MEQELKNKVAGLERKVEELMRFKEEYEIQDRINVDGAFDGTNIPVRVNGIRRNIATAAP